MKTDSLFRKDLYELFLSENLVISESQIINDYHDDEILLKLQDYNKK
jgi:hypothetical protein